VFKRQPSLTPVSGVFLTPRRVWDGMETLGLEFGETTGEKRQMKHTLIQGK